MNRRLLSPLALIALVILASCIFVQHSLNESFSHGRLASQPNYDDVTYFLSGTQALQSFRSGHVIETLTGYMHSPYSVLLAAGSFAIWGAKDWAPYAGNAVVVASYLAALCYLLRHLPLGVRMGSLLVFLSLPFATMAVVEFRPDIMWAILVGFTAIYLSTANRHFSSRIEAVGVGLLYGAALMTKPSTFLMTTAVVGLAVLLRTLRGTFSGELTAFNYFSWLLLFVLSFLLLAGPYYLLHFDRVWSYFYENSFGKHKDFWIPKQTLSEHLSYYVDSEHASGSNLGRWRLPIFLFVGSSLLFCSLRGGQRGERGILLSVTVTLGATLLASSLFGMKSAFLGGAFYGTLLFAFAYLLAEILRPFEMALSRPITQLLAFAGLAAISLTMHTWPDYSKWDAARANYYRKANDEVWDGIRRALREYSPANGVVDVYYSNSSPIPQELVRLRAIQERIPLRIFSGVLLDSMVNQRASFERCGIIIVQDPGLPEVNQGFPGEKLQTEITQEVLSRPEFDLAREIPINERQRVYLLYNKKFLVRRQ